MNFKKLISLSLVTLMLTSSFTVFAGSKVGSTNVKDLEYLPKQLELPTEVPKPYKELESMVKRSISGEDYWKATRTYKGTSKRFVKYLSSSWAKAYQYTWSKNVAYSGGCTSGISASALEALTASFSFNFTRTESFSTTIFVSADKTKLSKLGFSSDFKIYSVNAKLYDWWTTKVLKTEKGSAYVPTKNTYVEVVYK